MKTDNLKTSAQWIKDHKYSMYRILDHCGWPNAKSWYNERIEEKTFQERLSYSSVVNVETDEKWTHPWSKVAFVEVPSFDRDGNPTTKEIASYSNAKNPTPTNVTRSDIQ